MFVFTICIISIAGIIAITKLLQKPGDRFFAMVVTLLLIGVAISLEANKNENKDGFYYLGVEVVNYVDEGVVFGTVDADETIVLTYHTDCPEEYADDVPYLLSMYDGGTPDDVSDDEVMVVWKWTS